MDKDWITGQIRMRWKQYIPNVPEHSGELKLIRIYSVFSAHIEDRSCNHKRMTNGDTLMAMI